MSQPKNGYPKASDLQARLRVLLVDDDACLLEVSKQILTDMGTFEIDHALSVDEALTKLPSGNYDVIISDYEMPKKDGLEFLKELREKKNETPFILFTGKGREEIAIKALNLGADYYLSKHGATETIYGELAHAITKSTKSAKTQNALKESEEKYRSLFDNSFDGVMLTKPNGTILAANPQACRMLNMTEEQIKKVGREGTIVKDEKLAVAIKERAQTGLARAELTFKRKDGTTFIGEVASNIFTDAEGIIKTSMVIRDITERKKAEAQLKESEERFRQLFTNMPSGVAVYNAVDNGEDFVFKDFNEAAEKIEHVSRREVIGKRLTKMFPGVKDFGLFEVLQRVYRTGVAEFFPINIYRDAKDPGTWRENWLYKLPNDDIVAIYNDVTERKKAEKAIAESEEKFRQAFTIGPNAFYISTLENGKVIEVNERFMEIFGRQREEIIGQTSLQLGMWANPSDREKMFELLKLEGKIKSFKIDCVRKNGQIFPAQVSISKLQAGNQQQLVGIIRDVSRYKQAEEDLKESEARYRGLADSLPETVFEVDRDGKLIYANLSAFANFGYSKEDFPNGTFIFDLIHQKDRKRAKENFKKALLYGHSNDNEYECVRKDGRDFPTMIVCKPIIVENRTVGLRGIIIDITQRKKTEAALLASEEKYRSTFESTGTALAIIEEDTTFSLVNTEFEKLSGYSKQELEGKKRWTEFLVKEDLDKMNLQHRLRRTNEKAALTQYEFRFIDRYGETKNVLLTINIIPGTKKSIASLIDITQPKKAEEELKLAAYIFDLATDSICVHDIEGNIVSFNEALYKTHGYSKDEMAKMKVQEIDAPESAAILESRIKFLLENGNAVFESVHVCKDRSLLPVEIHARIIDIEGKKLILSIARDITERKVTEKKIQENAVLRSTLLDNVPCTALILEKGSRRIVASNKLAQEQGALPGKICYQTCANRSVPCTFCLAPKLWATNEKQSLKVEYEGKYYRGIWLPFNEDLYVHYIFDITDAQKSEEQLALMNEKLRVVGSLTRHDVGNNLMAVKSNLYLLKKRIVDSPELAKYFDGIDDALASSDKLFEFSHLYERIGVEKPVSIDIFDCFNQAAMLLPNLDKIRVFNECEGLKVVADSLLMQLFYNFIDNSLKHGQKVTQIRLHYKKDVNELKLVYEDNGVGIPKADKSKLFDAGFSTGKGYGLGLYLAKKMMSVYGWTITEQGEEGKSAKFVITIPECAITALKK